MVSVEVFLYLIYKEDSFEMNGARLAKSVRFNKLLNSGIMRGSESIGVYVSHLFSFKPPVKQSLYKQRLLNTFSSN